MHFVHGMSPTSLRSSGCDSALLLSLETHPANSGWFFSYKGVIPLCWQSLSTICINEVPVTEFLEWKCG